MNEYVLIMRKRFVAEDDVSARLKSRKIIEQMPTEIQLDGEFVMRKHGDSSGRNLLANKE